MHFDAQNLKRQRYVKFGSIKIHRLDFVKKLSMQAIFLTTTENSRGTSSEADALDNIIIYGRAF